MFSTSNLFVSVFIICSVICGTLPKKIPEFITLCKRQQNTINDCARNAVEELRPMMVKGIPELNVPSIDPLIIPEIRTVSGELSQLRASAKDIKVTGGSNFIIKSVSVDLDTFTIRARVRFPKLHFEGRYKLDTRVLVVPLNGQGNLVADATKCDAEITLNSKLEERDGKEYLKFTKVDTDINVKDYHIRLDGLFNGDKTLGDATNEAINQNRGEFLRATKPYLEKTVSKLLLDAANNIVDGVVLDEVLPRP